MPLRPNHDKTTAFVLVHGAWHGGWCWGRVAERLRALGHRVYTPTQTGLGERKHLLNANITLDTFVEDIAQVLLYEDLDDIVLVGHSFAGITISGVADRMPERIRRLVYLDAFILDNGVTAFDILPDGLVEKLRAAAREHEDGLALPPPRPKTLGLFKPDDVAFVTGRLTPQPLGTYETALHLRRPIGNGLPCAYLHCVGPAFAPIEDSWQWANRQAGWTCLELDAGHDAMVSAPDLLAKRLIDMIQLS